MNSSRWTLADAISLTISCAVIAGVFLAPHLVSQGIVPDRTLCVSQRVFGVDCPGCGLTRSFVILGTGELGASLRMNWIAPSLAALALIHLAARGAKLLFRDLGLRTLDVATIVTIILLYFLRTVEVWL